MGPRVLDDMSGAVLHLRPLVSTVISMPERRREHISELATT